MRQRSREFGYWLEKQELDKQIIDTVSPPGCTVDNDASRHDEKLHDDHSEELNQEQAGDAKSGNETANEG